MKSSAILSSIIHYMKYARYMSEYKRRETFQETITRNKEMHQDKFPFLADKIEDIYNSFVSSKVILPAMRSLQFAGKAIEKNNARMFNCSFSPINHYKCFSEAMFLLLSGVGYGYSVLFKEVNKLPKIQTPKETKNFIVDDSIEGWADSINILIKSFFGMEPLPIFDFSNIRKRGMLLVTSGGKAPGYEPLKNCLEKIKAELENLLSKNINKLSPINVHSILCHIADAVLSGGIRRASMICLFDINDIEMRKAKSNEWWNLNPHFARANNSALVKYDDITYEQFLDFWKDVVDSKSGEPGIFWTNSYDLGTNPCAEASLRPYTFCNLVEINANKILNQEHFNQVCKASSFLNTLQATYTNFHYLRPEWKKFTEEDALLGIGITGIASGKLDYLNLSTGAKLVKEENNKVANWLNINNAARSCLVKPAGTSSLILETSSGLHDYHCEYYFRRVRVNKQESIYFYLKNKLPDLVEDEIFNPNETAVITFPQKSPNNAKIIKNSNALDLLNRAKKYNLEWIRPSHNRGDNFHNVSATISVKDNEWQEVGQWLWDNRYSYHGITVLPFSGHTYKQAPFESCTKQDYENLYQKISDIDLTEIIEETDETTLQSEVACFGGVCNLI